MTDTTKQSGIDPTSERAIRSLSGGRRGSARRARVAMSARFLLRSLSLRGSSFLLALLAIVVGATVTSTMLTIRADLTAKMSRELRRYGPNLLVTPREQGLTGGGSATPVAAAVS